MIIDKDIMRISSYKDVLVKTANWLIKKGKLKPKHCPVNLTGKLRYIINKRPMHSKGVYFNSPHRINKGMWVETGHSAKTLLHKAECLLEQYGFPFEILKIFLEDKSFPPDI